MSPQPKVLVVLTSHDKLLNGDPTGWYLPELAHPYYVLSPTYDLVFASPKGGEAPLDPGSVEAFKEDAESTKFLAEVDAWKNTKPLSEFVGKAKEFAAIFFPGGHGPVFDLPVDKDAQALIAEFWQAGLPVAAVCHAPAVFAETKLSDGSLLIKGKKFTGFSNVEEEQSNHTNDIPFLLETKLQEQGGIYSKAAEPWGEWVVKDGLLLTGQNPASAKKIGIELDALIKSRKAAPAAASSSKPAEPSTKHKHHSIAEKAKEVLHKIIPK